MSSYNNIVLLTEFKANDYWRCKSVKNKPQDYSVDKNVKSKLLNLCVYIHIYICT